MEKFINFNFFDFEQPHNVERLTWVIFEQPNQKLKMFEQIFFRGIDQPSAGPPRLPPSLTFEERLEHRQNRCMYSKHKIQPVWSATKS